MLLQLLESVGFEVLEAENGQEAISIWSSWHPHLIWMDMRMPVLDGYEATRYIKSNSQETAPIVIALTASAFEEKLGIVMAAGCDDYVIKPFPESIIWDKMAKYLNVSYVYAQDELSLIATANESFKLSTSELKIMPRKWIAELEQAALELNEESITELLHQIPKDNAFLVEALQDKLDNFDLDSILDLTEQILSDKLEK